MLDDQKTKEELIEELNALRGRVSQLEQAGGRKEGKPSDESEQTLRMVFHNAPDGMLLADIESKKFRMANNAICRMLGYTQQEIVKLGVADIHAAEDLPFAIGQFEKLTRGEISVAPDIPVKRKDNTVFHADISASETMLSGILYLMGIFRDVTDRKNVRERDEIILKTCIDGFWLIDADGQILEVNDAYCRMSGFSRDELLTMSIEDVEAGETPQEIAQHIREVIDGGAHRFESRHRCKDGTIMDLDISAHFMGLDGGRVFTFFRDITERRRAELALQQSEEKFRRITEQGFDVVFTAAPDGTLTYASPSVKRTLGYRPDEMIGKNAAQFVPESSMPNVIQQFKEIAEGRSFEGGEVEIRRKDGSIAVIELNFAPVYDGATIIGAQASARDITERKRTIRALRESEEKYRTLVESADESIASIDENGVFLFINTTGAERVGGKPEDYVGKTMWDLFPKTFADRKMASIHKVIEQGHGMTYTSLTELRGQLRWHNTTIEPLKASGNGKIVSVMVIARDVHDMKLAEEELAGYRERMAHADLLASLGTLSATVAHELTQPLTVIRLSLDNLLDDLKAASSPETLTRRLENSLAEVSNLTTIIDRFRNFARKSSESTVGEIDLQVVAEKIVTLLTASARRAGVALRLKDMDGLPLVHANEKDFEQLFFALVQNAIQAADGEKARELVISGSVKDGYVELRFADDCGGIAPENLDAVFEPFFTTKPLGQGTGLGLCIVREIASRAGGKVSIESELGKGSTFFVTFPVDEDGMSGSNNDQ